MDWGIGASTGLNYNQAIRNLGQYVALAYEVLSPLRNDINIENNLLNIYCIGHSLGSHFCGLLSQLFMSRLNMKFEKITALGIISFKYFYRMLTIILFHYHRPSWTML